MFTGIIGHIGFIDSLVLHPNGGRIVINAPTLTPLLAISKSVAVNGCCLTVTFLENDRFTADLSAETLRCTSFGASQGTLPPGSLVNLEQPLTAGKEFGGHFVLGHIDGVGHLAHLRPEGDNWWLGVRIPENLHCYVVPKGSITIDGISLTVANWRDGIVEVAVIPYTYEHTTLRDRHPGDAVNLEGDILGKYIERHLAARISASSQSPAITLARLADHGF